MKKVIIIGGDGSEIKTAVAILKEKGIEAEVMSAPEELVSFRNNEVKQRLEIEKDIKLHEPIFSPPPTRAERRKKARKQ